MQHPEELIGDGLLEQEMAGADLHGLQQHRRLHLIREQHETGIRKAPDHRLQAGEHPRLAVDIDEHGGRGAFLQPFHQLGEAAAEVLRQQLAVVRQRRRHGVRRSRLIGDQNYMANGHDCCNS